MMKSKWYIKELYSDELNMCLFNEDQKETRRDVIHILTKIFDTIYVYICKVYKPVSVPQAKQP